MHSTQIAENAKCVNLRKTVIKKYFKDNALPHDNNAGYEAYSVNVG